MDSERSSSDIDPILGLEHIRRNILGVSKPAFYNDIYHQLAIIELSARRRGVRKSALEQVLAARTRPPQRAA